MGTGTMVNGLMGTGDNIIAKRCVLIIFLRAPSPDIRALRGGLNYATDLRVLLSLSPFIFKKLFGRNFIHTN